MTATITAKLVSIDGDLLRRALKAALCAVDNDSARAHLWGVCFSSKDGKLRINATNGHWLLDYVSDVECPEIGEVILDKDTVKTLINFVGKAPNVMLTFEGKLVTVNANGNIATYVRVDAKYPTVDQVIPRAKGAIESIGVSAKYLVDVGKAFDTLNESKIATVTRMTFKSDLDPIVFDSDKVPGLKAVLMPCRI